MDEKLKAHQLKQKELDDSYQVIFEGKGEEVLKDLNEFCGKDAICFKADEKETAFLLGARSVSLYIQDRINHVFTKNADNADKLPDSYNKNMVE